MRNAIFILVFVILLVGCSNSKATQVVDKEDVINKAPSATAEKEQSIKVDKGILSVKVTLPTSLFSDGDIEKTIADAKKEGVNEVIRNEDGSLTYVVSKAKYGEMMKSVKDSMNTTIDDLKTGKDFASIKDVAHNDSFSEFIVTVDKEAYNNSMDAFATMVIGLSSMLYQAFDGVSPENNKITIKLKDEKTGNVFDTVTYPDAMK